MVSVAITARASPTPTSPHVFDRFFRAVDQRSQPGSGLGLAIVKSVVDAHRGTVFARNAEGGGAEARLSCPS